MEEQEKAGRLPKQFGDFGENPVMWWLGQFFNYNVALVDHEGADIIAHNTNEKLAISVKSIHRASTIFDVYNQTQLRKFAANFGDLTPAVAFVFADRENIQEAKLDIFLFLLQDLDVFCDKGMGITRKSNGDFEILNGAQFIHLKKLADAYDKKIKHLRLQQIHGDWLN
jgi:hypothetical protein